MGDIEYMKNKFFLTLALSFLSVFQIGEARVVDYEKHLPKDIYYACKKFELLDEESLESSKQVPSLEGFNQFIISVDDMDGLKYVLFDYKPAKIKDNFSGIQLGYDNGKLMGYAIFDGEGCDYLVIPPPLFTEEDEKEMASFILDKIYSAFEKTK